MKRVHYNPFTELNAQPDETCLACGNEVKDCSCVETPDPELHEAGEFDLMDTSVYPSDDFADELDGPDTQEEPK